MNRPVRVLVGARGAAFVTGLMELLRQQTGISVVGGTVSSAEMIKMLNDKRPHVVLWDLDLGAVPPSILELVSVLALVGNTGSESLLSAIHSDMCGMVFRDASPAVLAAAVRSVAVEGGWVEPVIGAILLRLVGRVAGSGPLSFADKLTRREHEVLALAALGNSVAEIGANLHLSDNGVKWHLSALRRRFGARNTTHLVAIALQTHLLQDYHPIGQSPYQTEG